MTSRTRRLIVPHQNARSVASLSVTDAQHRQAAHARSLARLEKTPGLRDDGITLREIAQIGTSRPLLPRCRKRSASG
jgi:hypothetical protein